MVSQNRKEPWGARQQKENLEGDIRAEPLAVNMLPGLPRIKSAWFQLAKSRRQYLHFPLESSAVSSNPAAGCDYNSLPMTLSSSFLACPWFTAAGTEACCFFTMRGGNSLASCHLHLALSLCAASQRTRHCFWNVAQRPMC